MVTVPHPELDGLALDLFCGAGGASLGIHRAGYDVIGIDKWPVAVASHQAAGMPAILADVGNLPLRSASWDLVWASPPCQPFTAAGKRTGKSDERDAIPAWLSALEWLRPPLAIMENVRGLTYEEHRDYLGWLLHQVRGLGYDVQYRTLQAADYGVPQTRERFIMIARNDGKAIRWPTVTHTEEPGLFTEQWVSMADALGWPRDGTLTTGKFANKAARRLDQPAPTAYFGHDFAGWCWDRPATSVLGDLRISLPGKHRTNGYQSEGVRVTVPDAAVLQGFPRDYPFQGNQGQRTQQIGNAVPPPLAHAICEANR